MFQKGVPVTFSVVMEVLLTRTVNAFVRMEHKIAKKGSKLINLQILTVGYNKLHQEKEVK